jgi:hypothetical protein
MAPSKQIQFAKKAAIAAMEWASRAPPNRRVMLGSGKCQTAIRNEEIGPTLPPCPLLAFTAWHARSGLAGAAAQIVLRGARCDCAACASPQIILDQAGAHEDQVFRRALQGDDVVRGARGSLTPRCRSAAHASDQSSEPPCSR